MSFVDGWTRRRFLAVSGGVAGQAAVGWKGIAQQTAELPARSRPPEVISGGTVPLMMGHTARPLQYRPVAGEFVIRNGTEFFNRPIYGVSSPTQVGDFRVDAGDLPEFSLYLPGHGGNLKIGFIAADGKGSKWGAQADEVIAKYRPGRMIYEIRDALLGKGMLRAELLTAGEGQGLMLKVEGQDLPAGVRLAWAFGGVSGKKGRRGGDIGCEVEPVSQFFQVRAEECTGNQVLTGGVGPVDNLRRYSDRPDGSVTASVTSKTARMVFDLPPNSAKSPVVASAADFKAWNLPPEPDSTYTWNAQDIVHPILVGSADLKTEPLYLGVYRFVEESPVVRGRNQAGEFSARSAAIEGITAALKVETPDEYVTAAGGALAIAAETIWDQKQQCVMHGGVAWRQALAGWRGPYVLDALGEHDRTKLQIRHWLAKQNVKPVDTAGQIDGVATGAADPNVHLTRHEGLLHSNGDLGNNHYDMNLVFFDVMLRHLMWTGDVDLAREVWPALQRHLAWERRMFRRTYEAGGKKLPLYEAYAAIWASDNLQYNGGGAAHSSAYNYFSLKTAAKIAKLLGEDGSSYEAEAELIHTAMNELLWVKERGLMAEAKDLLGPQTAYDNPALWTVYHALDSEVPDRRQAWQMCAERLATLPHVPVHGEGVPAGCYMLSCSDWMPYVWSLNLLLMGENMHMALALWQAGMREEAYRIYKGQLLDSMYMGLCPGDFHMTSALDAHRQEAQRDFGDPIGCSSRALIEGLFGVQPDLLSGVVRIRPGFPAEWNSASLKHRGFDLAWKRDGMNESFEFTSRFAKPAKILLELPARTTSLPTVTDNGAHATCTFDPEAVGGPMVRIELPAAAHHIVSLRWSGRTPMEVPASRSYRAGDALELPRGVTAAQLDDPQSCLRDGRIAAAGFHIVFAKMKDGQCSWQMPIAFTAKTNSAEFSAVPVARTGARMEPVNLDGVLKENVAEIFTRIYAEPRSPYCSLAMPDNLLGGWANPDGRATIDDAGLRGAGGVLKTSLGVEFRTPATGANCRFLSHWKQDEARVSVPLSGRASGVYLLMAGTTNPQCSRMNHATVSVAYADGSTTKLELRNPENWWPIEQDYLIDDYLFVNEAPLPPRVDLRSGQTRLLDRSTFKGRGRNVQGGSATVLHLPLAPDKELKEMQVECELYGVVVGLLGATLVRA